MRLRDFIIIFVLLFLVSCSSVHRPCTDAGLKCEQDHAVDSLYPPEMPGTFR